MTKRHRIAVVGCGIAGACSALLLKRQGHDVTVFEQAAKLEPVGAGIMLQPLGQLVLDRIGLLPAVIARSEPIHQLHAIQRDGRTMIRMPFQASGTGMHGYGVHRGDIFEVLVRALRAQGVEIVLDAPIDQTDVNSTTVALVTTNGSRRFEGFEHVVIANGSRSSLRHLPGFRAWDREYEYAAIWCNGHSTQVHNQLLQIVDGSKHLMGILPLGENRVGFFWGIASRDQQRCMDQPIERWKDEVSAFYPAAAEVVDPIRDWSQTRYGTYRRALVEPVFDARHIFIGDAAHSMSPHLGQGLNLALFDAFRFASACEDSNDWLTACRRFAAGQRDHLRYYRFVTALLTPFFQSDTPWRALFRDVTLPWMHRLPVIRGQMALTMTGLKSGFLGGPLKF